MSATVQSCSNSIISIPSFYLTTVILPSNGAVYYVSKSLFLFQTSDFLNIFAFSLYTFHLPTYSKLASIINNVMLYTRIFQHVDFTAYLSPCFLTHLMFPPCSQLTLYYISLFLYSKSKSKIIFIYLLIYLGASAYIFDMGLPASRIFPGVKQVVHKCLLNE